VALKRVPEWLLAEINAMVVRARRTFLVKALMVLVGSTWEARQSPLLLQAEALMVLEEEVDTTEVLLAKMLETASEEVVEVPAMSVGVFPMPLILPLQAHQEPRSALPVPRIWSILIMRLALASVELVARVL